MENIRPILEYQLEPRNIFIVERRFTKFAAYICKHFKEINKI